MAGDGVRVGGLVELEVRWVVGLLLGGLGVVLCHGGLVGGGFEIKFE